MRISAAEYKAGVEKALWELIADVTPSVKSDKAVVQKLDLIRMLVKGHPDPKVHMVSCAIYGLLLAELPVTDENIRWLIRDESLGFDKRNELFEESDEHIVRIYPAMDAYKNMLHSLHDAP
ncbi:hypothetical protein HF673_03255 [Acidithiobacillus thiooxidans]|uniref:hypothetical protein n=1 Tax=Acidithiobacillus thiooxidans TaxID=930 RepID=UPI001C077325|nr:hypothetical protein [Acidithiobacillus thiooxidans]MBU2834824.1 hypothetical protein [Acidithiobacillus thiooxidans]